MTNRLENIKWVWRFLTALLVATLMMVMIWLFSSFNEPPEIDFIFTSLLVLIAYACLETVRFMQLRLYKSLKFSIPTLNNAVSFIGSIIAGTVVYIILFYGFKWLDYFVNYSEPPMPHHMVSAVIVGAIMAIIFALIHFIIIWEHQYYNAHIQNEQFKKEIAKVNLSILKHQLDPHFMFNNFNTLYYLIDDDKKLAKTFLKNISTIYRYILDNSDKASISVHEEYNITKQYLEILQQRYANFLIIEDHVKLNDIKNKKTPPLVLQQLIENAVKHNRIDEASPLKIKLSSTENYFTVTNNLNKKRTEPTPKTGLINIKKRYQFLTKKNVVVKNANNVFTVSIPLINNES